MVDIIALYRPPYSAQHPVSIYTFVSEFADFANELFLTANRCLFMGDFNIQINRDLEPSTIAFVDVLNTLSLNQLVIGPTHVSGNTLDLILIRESSDFSITNVRNDFFLSDHRFILATLSTCRPVLVRKRVQFRRLNSIDHESFRASLSDDMEKILKLESLDDMVTAYNYHTKKVLDDHAPVVTKLITARQGVPWFDSVASQLKTMTRNAERHWLKHPTPENHGIFRSLRNKYKNHVESSKRAFIRQEFESCGNDTRQLFDTVAKITGTKNSNPLPEGVSDEQLAEDFSKYFYNKVDVLRKDLDHYPLFIPPEVEVPAFGSFSNVDVSTVSSLIQNAKPTTCTLDPLPSSLVKTHCDIFPPVFCKIINTSLSTGEFHSDWKQAIVKPLLKKSNLDHVKKNYRPVSNLSFLSKLVEKASLISFSKHMDNHGLLPSYQSAYRAYHSTETLLVKLHNDIMCNMERKSLTPLVAMDLSSAFDTVNHQLLLDILERCFGACDVAKEWMSSYLNGRQFNVCINKSLSVPLKLDFSVPQGSINGPVYFTCYSSTMISCVRDDQPLIGYADDHSIYSSFRAGDVSSEEEVIGNLSSTLGKVKDWMQCNRLKMNDEKSEFIIFGSKNQLPKCITNVITIGDIPVHRSDKIKLLGVFLDESLNLKYHINMKARAAALAMSNLKKIRHYLDRSSCLKLANATIFWHMDYCNGLFFNLPESTLHPLQRIQNLTAKLILGRSKFDSASEALKELHILPIKARIEYKILLLVFKCLHSLAPAYLSVLLELKSSYYSTRSSEGLLLKVPFTSRKSFADRAFSVAGPKLWNALPIY
ncbi:hypothetical protein HOLleu_17189 [Holothuria leucospilota]|uniref:Reverse transcriptase domain-containing protein n=1 Tax=Holothuria leucospilota TaxID=206669 RepID=A0A9Q1C695_HOLLE|nr:hypothetical protein HOLleu_17189 [Holothuria leucospilota]